MNITCPCCHAKYSLDVALEGAAAGELQVILAQAGPLARPLLAYLGMFRSKARALSFDRAVRLAGEVMALVDDHDRLAAALAETVEALRQKRDAGQIQPLKNHNYLKRVLESVAERGLVAAPVKYNMETGYKPVSKLDSAQAQLIAWADAGRDDFRMVLAHGLTALLALPLAKAPDVRDITKTASLWERDLFKKGLTAQDSSRLEIAFDRLLSHVKDWFPVPDAVMEYLPRKERIQELPEPAPNAEQQAQAKMVVANILSSLERRSVSNGIDEEQRRRGLSQQAHDLREENNAEHSRRKRK